MIGFGDGGLAKVLAAALLVSVTLLAPATPTAAQKELVGSYVVDLAEVWRFDGGIEAKTFTCSTKGSCVSRVRVEMHGETFDYLVFAKATATTATISFSGRDRAAPKLITGSGYRVVVPRSLDGAGSQDTTLTALNASGYYTSKPYTMREALPLRVWIANFRVTVRPDDGTERSR